MDQQWMDGECDEQATADSAVLFAAVGATAEVNLSTLAWADRFGVCRDRKQRDYLAGTGIGLAASLTIPDGPTELRRIYSDATLWFYAVDDRIADEAVDGLSPEVSLQLLRLVRTIESPAATPYLAASWVSDSMGDILVRLEGLADRPLVRRWVADLHAFILNVVLSVTVRPIDQSMSLDDYVIMRLPYVSGLGEASS